MKKIILILSILMVYQNILLAQQPVTFYIVRHGKTMLNTLDRVQGWSDSPLTPQGISVAEYLGKGLQGVNFKAAYASDLGRARQTIGLVLKNKGEADFPVTFLEAFRENCFGMYEGDLNSSMWGDAGIYWQYPTLKDFFKYVAENGVSKAMQAVKALDTLKMAETNEEVKARTQQALRMIAEKEYKAGGGNVLIVGHGMAIGTMISDISDKKINAGHIGNASVSKVIYDGKTFTVESVGDMSYVEKGKKANK